MKPHKTAFFFYLFTLTLFSQELKTEVEQHEPRIMALEETSEDLPDENSTLADIKSRLLVISRSMDLYLIRLQAVLGESLGSPCTSSSSEVSGTFCLLLNY